MVDITDLAGISKPLDRLIEVCSEGIGALFRPTLARRNADANAYQINKIAQTIAENQGIVGLIRYEDGPVAIESVSRSGFPALPEAEIEKRLSARLVHQELKRQLNIERVTQQAAHELAAETEVSPEKPDTDWISRFFRMAEDITSEQMQILWGKVLAGEVKRPGSYSLRTLDVLKNINNQEAELFVRLAKLAVVERTIVYAINPDDGKYLAENHAVGFHERLVLHEIGLIELQTLGRTIDELPEDQEIAYTVGTTVLAVSTRKDAASVSIPVIVFTEVGKQLLGLVEKLPADPRYIERFMSYLNREGVVIKTGRLTSSDGQFVTVSYDDS